MRYVRIAVIVAASLMIVGSANAQSGTLNLLKGGDTCGNNRKCCTQKCQQKWGHSAKDFNKCMGYYRCNEKS